LAFLEDVVRRKHKHEYNNCAHGRNILEEVDEGGAAMRSGAIQHPRSRAPQVIPEREAINGAQREVVEVEDAWTLDAPCSYARRSLTGRGEGEERRIRARVRAGRVRRRHLYQGDEDRGGSPPSQRCLRLRGRGRGREGENVCRRTKKNHLLHYPLFIQRIFTARASVRRKGIVVCAVWLLD